VCTCDEQKILCKQWPGIEPLPTRINLGGDSEFGVTLLEEFTHLTTVAAEKPEFQPVELPLDLIEEGDQQRQIDRMGERDPQCAHLAALEGRGERARADGGLVALLQQGVHALTELGQSGRTLAPEQVTAKLGLQLLDCPRQRRLCHIAFIRSTREIERPRDREEISNLMHFHDRTPPDLARSLAD
jgi:hypothetical protein